MIAGGGVAINKIKLVDPEAIYKANQLINNKFLVVQKGKKNYYLVIIE